ncbi:hypothetical protein BJ322DRAFT_1214681 [Thelephora terrestris]|uniref:Uncharacterized protein n=1 Tax=Thelephora terrestris TaxID=56493 RepID=A0A9P6H563_9AGAM|nr:hypothetical protein BJ322DRAFT_1214681 [Thelephora terrestris]
MSVANNAVLNAAATPFTSSFETTAPYDVEQHLYDSPANIAHDNQVAINFLTAHNAPAEFWEQAGYEDPRLSGPVVRAQHPGAVLLLDAMEREREDRIAKLEKRVDLMHLSSDILDTSVTGLIAPTPLASPQSSLRHRQDQGVPLPPSPPWSPAPVRQMVERSQKKKNRKNPMTRSGQRCRPSDKSRQVRMKLKVEVAGLQDRYGFALKDIFLEPSLISNTSNFPIILPQHVLPQQPTYKVANGISTISRIDRRAATRKTYACAAGTPYTTDDQILEVVTEVDAERLRETIPHLMGLTWDDELWVRTIITEKVAFQMRGRFGELEHPIKKELWYTLQRGIYDQDLLEHGATVPRAVCHATASTSLLWSLVREGESRVERLEREVKEAKADVLRLSAEGLQMKETLAAFQQGTNEALEAMVANHQELIAGLKTEELENVVAVLTAQVESLQDKTCNCKEGPKLVGQGTADVPFELESLGAGVGLLSW